MVVAFILMCGRCKHVAAQRGEAANTARMQMPTATGLDLSQSMVRMSQRRNEIRATKVTVRDGGYDISFLCWLIALDITRSTALSLPKLGGATLHQFMQKLWDAHGISSADSRRHFARSAVSNPPGIFPDTQCNA